MAAISRGNEGYVLAEAKLDQDGESE